MNKKIIIVCLACAISLSSMAQYRTLNNLHVEGRNLKDSQGHTIVLHGVMDTPSPYFNDYRWTKWVPELTSNNIPACLTYFDKLFSAITDTSQGAYCDAFRLHMDPCWTNDPNKTATNGGGENDISRFSESRYEYYLQNLYVPLAKSANEHGLYVVVRPPGVCPTNIYVDGDYQQYLLYVWDQFSKNTYIQEHAGVIGIELANEPVNVLNADGSNTANTLHDFFQPIVDKIRANGFKGIIWVPGSSWQANYTGYATYPITDELKNIGYAVHDYVGWYGSDENNPNVDGAISQFKSQVPVVETNPIMITEVDWSPQVANFDENDASTYHVNEHGEKIPNNLGTWATGTTSNWGNAYKKLIEHYGNISMTLSGTGCYIDIDSYINNNKVIPAFSNKTGGDEACGVACFNWYKTYAEENMERINYVPTTEDLDIESITASSNNFTISVGSNAVVTIISHAKSGKEEEITGKCTVTSSDENVAYYNGSRIIAKEQGACTVTFKYTDTNGKTLTTTVDIHVPEYFPLTNVGLNPSIYGNGFFDETTGKLQTGQYGFGGWKFASGLDLSAYDYLTVELQEANTSWGLSFRLFDSDNYWSNPYSKTFDGKTSITINLNHLDIEYEDANKVKQYRTVDPSHIYIAGFWTMGDSPIYIKSIKLTKKATSGISQLDNNEKDEIASVKYYTVDGHEVNARYNKGMKIKKITYKNGNVKINKCL